MKEAPFEEMGHQLIRDLGEILPTERTKRRRCPAELKRSKSSTREVGMGERLRFRPGESWRLWRCHP